MQADKDGDEGSEEEGGRTRGQAAAAAAAPVEFEEDGNTDLCVLCGLGGSLLCCDGCPAAYHMRCIGESAKSIPPGEWLCPECSVGGRGLHPFIFHLFLCLCLCLLHIVSFSLLSASWFCRRHARPGSVINKWLGMEGVMK